MNCRYCSTELPEGALFCGECGRAVQPKTAPGRPVAAQPSGDPEAQEDPEPAQVEPPQPESDGWSPPAEEPVTEVEPEPDARSDPEPGAEVEPEPGVIPEPDAVPELDAAPPVEDPVASPPSHAVPTQPISVEPIVAVEEHCTQCGAVLAASDIFCGECGFVRQSVARRQVSDTNVLDPFPWGLPREPQRPVPPPTETVTAPPVVSPPPVPPAEAAPAGPVPAPHGDPLVPPPLVSPSSDAPRPLPELGDVDETRLVDRTARGERFVLQFSTGESVSVSGTGLIGRNPIPEPGEYFDAIVAIIDPGKSVSKTHLEFGQEGGAFWVSDRFSGNGTVVREPERAPRRADPGKRYRLVRGSRVDIGEQFFIVS